MKTLKEIKDEVAKEFGFSSFLQFHEYQAYEGYHLLSPELIDAIAQKYASQALDIAAEEAPKWISCMDRLPETGTEVIVKTVDGTITALCRLIRYEEDTGFYWDNVYGGSNWYSQESITHWMSLRSSEISDSILSIKDRLK